jgi:hypothetical protein
MRNYPHIKENTTKQRLIDAMYKAQKRRSRFGPDIGALQRPFAQDSGDIVAFIEGSGRDCAHMFATPLGRAIESDPQGWPRTRWAEDNEDHEIVFKAAFRWMMQFDSRIRAIGDLDEALLAEGIDFALTGDLVGRSNTWRSPHGWRSLKRTEQLLRGLLASSTVSVFVGDKNQMEALRQLRKQGHIITVSAPYADEIEDVYGAVIQRSAPLVALTYKQTEL